MFNSGSFLHFKEIIKHFDEFLLTSCLNCAFFKEPLKQVRCVSADISGGCAELGPPPGGLCRPRKRRSARPPTVDQRSASEAIWLLHTEPLLPSPSAPLLSPTQPRPQPLWDNRLPPLREETGLGSARCPRIIWH